MKKILFVLLFVSTIISAQDYNWVRMYNLTDGGLDSIKVGDGTFSSDNSAFLINRDLLETLGSGGGHGLRDESVWTVDDSLGFMGYASYDAIMTLGGSANRNHWAGFQSRPQYLSTGTITALRGFTYYPNVDSGIVTASYGFDIADAVGSGNLVNQTGVYIQELTKGSSTNYAIYTVGATQSVFEGDVILGSDLIATGALSGSNFYTASGTNAVGFGNGIAAYNSGTGAPGYYMTLLGHGAGAGLTGAGSTFSTLIGTSSGANQTTSTENTFVGAYTGYWNGGSGNIFIGNKAGYNESGSNALMIDNRNRTDEAGGRTKSLIYGIFADAPADQSVTINGTLKAIALDFSSITTDSTTVSAGYVYVTSDGIVRVKQ